MKARIRLKDGAVDLNGTVFTQRALRELTESGTVGEVDLKDATGKVIGKLENLRLTGNKTVVGDFDLGSLTPAEVQQILRQSTPVIRSRGLRARPAPGSEA